jgi:hypothetical protein
MASTITHGSFGKDLIQPVNKWIVDEFAKKQAPEWTKVFEVVNPGNRAYVDEMSVVGMGLAQEKTDLGKIHFDSMRQGFNYRYTMIRYAIGFMISKDAYDDGNAAMQMIKGTKFTMFSLEKTKEILAAMVLNRAFNSDYTNGDGLELCSEVHVLKGDGSTNANEESTAADISEAALEAARLTITKFKTESGLRCGYRPEKLVVPSALVPEAYRILNSTKRYDTANNDANWIKDAGIFPGGIVEMRELTDEDAYFCLTDCPDGLKYQEREKTRFGQEDEWETMVAKFMGTFRGAWGWSNWRCIWGSPGAA